MPSRILAAVGLTLVLVGCGASAGRTPVAPTASPSASVAPSPVPQEVELLCQGQHSTLAELPLPAALEAVLDPLVSRGMAAMDTAGMTIAVQCAGSPLYAKGYGSADLDAGVPAEADTVYEIGSVSKQFTAAEIMTLAEAERLGLDDPVGRYLAWLPTTWQPITLRQLLSHTGGLPDHFAIFREDPDTAFDWTKDYGAAELAQAFLALDDELVAPAGSRFSYSNTGYVLLTAVIEELTGAPFAAVMDGAFFAPLGLERTAFCSPTLPDLATGYTIGPDGPAPGLKVPAFFFSGAAGICSSAPDLIRWERRLADGTAVSPEAFQAMSSPAALGNGTPVPYGLGLHLDSPGGRRAIFHEGGTASFSSWLAYYPDQDLMVAVLSNTLGPNMLAIRALVVDLTAAVLDE